MPGLKEVRLRIASVKSTQQITSAMKLVSASKLRRAQERIIGLRPYYRELHNTVQQIVQHVPQYIDSPFFQSAQNGRCLIIALSSNRGLCGTFNANVLKYILSLQQHPDFEKYFQDDAVEFITLGKKITEQLRKKRYRVLASYNEKIEKPLASEIFQIAQEVMNMFLEKRWECVYFVYNSFKNPAQQYVIHEKYLPLDKPQTFDKFYVPPVEFIYQPDIESITSTLFPFLLKAHFLKVVLENSAGEHGARMTAMHKATDNAAELLKELQLSYNKARQAAITKEIIEIISAANALKE